MVRPRVRIRYRKEHDLRFLGHHDLLRTWERLLRRADVRPAQTEGFHKRARLNFPSALAVGICGLDEVIELELEADQDPAALAASLDAQAPAGLSIASIERMPAGARFSQPCAAEYDIRVPDARQPDVAARLERWRCAESTTEVVEEVATPTRESTSAAAPSFAAPEAEASAEDASSAPAGSNVAATVTKPAPDRLPATVQGVQLVDGALRMRLTLGEAGAVRPRELLAWLDLDDLETSGALLRRTRVEVST
ncbi:MAG: TIGR03936 family radical SAM-associated protein [Pirellulales bacterium]